MASSPVRFPRLWGRNASQSPKNVYSHFPKQDDAHVLLNLITIKKLTDWEEIRWAHVLGDFVHHRCRKICWNITKSTIQKWISTYGWTRWRCQVRWRQSTPFSYTEVSNKRNSVWWLNFNLLPKSLFLSTASCLFRYHPLYHLLLCITKARVDC